MQIWRESPRTIEGVEDWLKRWEGWTGGSMEMARGENRVGCQRVDVKRISVDSECQNLILKGFAGSVKLVL